MSDTPILEAWKALPITATTSHPLKDPAGKQRRAISVKPGTAVAGQPLSTVPYWCTEIDCHRPDETGTLPPTEVLAVQDGIVLYGANGDGIARTAFTDPFADQFGTLLAEVDEDLTDTVMLGIKSGAAYIVVVYRNLTTVSIDATPATVPAGTVLGTTTHPFFVMGAYRGTVLTFPIYTLPWVNDPLRTVFPTDILWTRNPPRREA